MQQAIQNINPVDPTDPTYSAGLTLQRLAVGNLLNEAHDQFLGLQRNRTDAGFGQDLSENFRYGILYELENRDGFRPFGTSFGFSWATELPESIDYNTQHFHAGAEYGAPGKTLTFAYDLQLFDNDLNALIWDNPLRVTDRTYSSAYVNGDGTSRAQMQLPVDNTSNTISLGGAANVGKGRVTGSFAYSLWTDEVKFTTIYCKYFNSGDSTASKYVQW